MACPETRAAPPVLVVAAVCLAGACGGENDPAFVDVAVVYVSRLPTGSCPDAGSLCYPMCAHHNAPAGLQAIVPLWGADTLRLTEAGGRYTGVLASVPTHTRLRLYGRDIGMCCVDACGYPPVLGDILLNGTTLTTVVREGLPPGVTAALEFEVDGRGRVQQ